MALLDSGCTWCLISFQTVEKLGLRLRKLRQPLGFSQINESFTGGAPPTFLTKPVSLRPGTHVETSRFILAPGITRPWKASEGST